MSRYSLPCLICFVIYYVLIIGVTIGFALAAKASHDTFVVISCNYYCDDLDNPYNMTIGGTFCENVDVEPNFNFCGGLKKNVLYEKSCNYRNYDKKKNICDTEIYPGSEDIGMIILIFFCVICSCGIIVLSGTLCCLMSDYIKVIESIFEEIMRYIIDFEYGLTTMIENCITNNLNKNINDDEEQSLLEK